MRVVIDTNVLVSALLLENSAPAKIVTHWRKGRFALLTAATQIEELRRVLSYPKLRERLTPSVAGLLVNELRQLTVYVDKLPKVDVSPDPFDNYLLSMALAGAADYLVTGDRQDVLALKKFEGTRIVSVSEFLTRLA